MRIYVQWTLLVVFPPFSNWQIGKCCTHGPRRYKEPKSSNTLLIDGSAPPQIQRLWHSRSAPWQLQVRYVLSRSWFLERSTRVTAEFSQPLKSFATPVLVSLRTTRFEVAQRFHQEGIPERSRLVRRLFLIVPSAVRDWSHIKRADRLRFFEIDSVDISSTLIELRSPSASRVHIVDVFRDDLRHVD